MVEYTSLGRPCLHLFSSYLDLKRHLFCWRWEFIQSRVILTLYVTETDLQSPDRSASTYQMLRPQDACHQT